MTVLCEAAVTVLREAVKTHACPCRSPWPAPAGTLPTELYRTLRAGKFRLSGMRRKAAKVLETADRKVEVERMEMEMAMEDESGTEGEGDGSRIERS